MSYVLQGALVRIFLQTQNKNNFKKRITIKNNKKWLELVL